MGFTEEYRPYHITDLQGQDSVKSVVKSMIRTRRIPGAILLTGSTSAGKTTIARIMGRAILCMNPTDKGNACGECVSCQEFDQESHADYSELDAASDRGIDAMRNLADRVRNSPMISEKRVVILDECHQITNAGWNAMLKTLENPPEHVVFILATTNPEKIIPTILGRASELKLRPPTVEECVKILMRPAKDKSMKKKGLKKSHLTKIAHATGAQPRKSLHILDQVYTMLLDASSSGKAVEEGVLNGYIERTVGASPEAVAAGVVRHILRGKPGAAIKSYGKSTADAGFLLKQITKTLRSAMYGSLSPKLMDPYYSDVLSDIDLISGDGQKTLHKIYEMFTEIRFKTSTYEVPVDEVLDGAIVGAGMLARDYYEQAEDEDDEESEEDENEEEPTEAEDDSDDEEEDEDDDSEEEDEDEEEDDEDDEDDEEDENDSSDDEDEDDDDEDDEEEEETPKKKSSKKRKKFRAKRKKKK